MKGLGLDLSHLSDDHAALQHLALAYQQAQQAQQWQPYAQQYMQHASEFQAFLAERQKAAQAQQQQQQAPWWKAPEFDPAWRSKLRSDPVTGRLLPVEGAPPDLAEKYYRWIDHQQRFFDGFAADPIKAIEPGIEQVARRVAEQIVQQTLGGYQSQMQAQDYIARNSEWLHLRDPQGNVVKSQQGQPVLSPAGERFRDYVVYLERSGVKDIQAQYQIAQSMLERDLHFARQQQAAAGQQQQQQQQQQTPVTPQQAANQQFLQQHNRPNVAGSIPAGGANANGNAPSQNQSLPLKERMRRDFAANGITDQMVNAGLR
jgi:hypothetical protein